jgi:hypothetical protein
MSFTGQRHGTKKPMPTRKDAGRGISNIPKNAENVVRVSWHLMTATHNIRRGGGYDDERWMDCIQWRVLVPTAVNSRLCMTRGPQSASELYRLIDRHLSMKFSANFCG